MHLNINPELVVTFYIKSYLKKLKFYWSFWEGTVCHMLPKSLIYVRKPFDQIYIIFM